MSFLSSLECSEPCGAGPYDPAKPHHLCVCGAPLLARYALDDLRATWRPGSLGGRAPTLWRYREALPIALDEEPVTLGEGMTPLIHAHEGGATFAALRTLRQRGVISPEDSVVLFNTGGALKYLELLRSDG